MGTKTRSAAAARVSPCMAVCHRRAAAGNWVQGMDNPAGLVWIPFCSLLFLFVPFCSLFQGVPPSRDEFSVDFSSSLRCGARVMAQWLATPLGVRIHVRNCPVLTAFVRKSPFFWGVTIFLSHDMATFGHFWPVLATFGRIFLARAEWTMIESSSFAEFRGVAAVTPGDATTTSDTFDLSANPRIHGGCFGV